MAETTTTTFTVTITYNPLNDIFNIKKDLEGPVTPVAIPGLENRNAPSDAYIYAPEGATVPIYNRENIITVKVDGGEAHDRWVNGETGKEEDSDPVRPNYDSVSFLTGAQKRWPKGTLKNLHHIIAAYATPQVPVYQAWQHIYITVCGCEEDECPCHKFTTTSIAQAEFYKQVGTALKDFGIDIKVESDADQE